MSDSTDQVAEHKNAYKKGVMQALALAQSRDVAGAREKLKGALAGSRIDSDGLIVLGHIFRAAGRPTAARTVLRRILGREPTNSGAFFSLLVTHLEARDLNAAIAEVIAFFDAGGKIEY